jgi:hypothetical protein
MKMSTLRKTLIGTALAAVVALYAGAPAAAAPIVANGDFATGDFTGWTLTPTDNGTLGASPYPRVTTSNPFGSGRAAELNVGQVSFDPGVYSGGILSQTIFLTGGPISFSADIASVNPIQEQQNFGGLFEVFVDGVLEASFDFAILDPGATEITSLQFSGEFAAGAHLLEIQVTRAAQSVNGRTPLEYLTNVIVEVPEPATLAVLLAGLLALGVARRRAQRIG